jgi:biotin transport system substrate-specific component
MRSIQIALASHNSLDHRIEGYMSKFETQTLPFPQDRAAEWTKQVAIVVGASLFVALCARVTLPLLFTPVPLTLQNAGVLLVGLLLGPRRGFAALALYLAEGAAGLPVFNPTGLGGTLQLFGPTGGFLMAYPFVAGLAGYVMERGRKTFANAAIAGLLAEVLLFVCGLSWLAVLTGSMKTAVRFGLYWFVFAEVIKILLAAAVAVRFRHAPKVQG